MASETSQVPSDSPPFSGTISSTALITSRSFILVARGADLTEMRAPAPLVDAGTDELPGWPIIFSSELR